MKQYTFDEIINLIADSLAEMEGKDVADLYNQMMNPEHVKRISYKGDSLFEEEE